ncbi:ketosteroid isomerase-like protein [Actinomycetospora succinea]|uniref:Ketosteroid isomerase-like protein n=1 Tax=Actinomycetospora succinea TaxID=663603 RepID=A0A4R6VIV0_9PSEU|nr:nuclear transport factor 2 family protein [Actinomycetospora succinea]TDQ63298.1 ketosteroid isomerase-like protein [Actinomycetospora succinea]
MSQRVDVVRRLLAAVETRNPAALLACYAERPEIHESAALPYGGVYRDAREHAAAFLRAWGPYQGGREPLGASFGETDDGRVVAVFRHRAVDESRGARLDEDEVGVYDVRDGLVVRSTMLHADPARLARFLADGSGR